MRGVRAGVSQVLVGAEEDARGVDRAEIDRLARIGRAQGHGAEGTEADLVHDRGLDARETRDDRPVLTELQRGRRAEAGQGVETIAAGTDVEGARPTGVVGREIDRTVARAAARLEVEVAEELGADRGQRARRADAGIAHQVERTLEGGPVTQADRAVVVAA